VNEKCEIRSIDRTLQYKLRVCKYNIQFCSSIIFNEC